MQTEESEILDRLGDCPELDPDGGGGDDSPLTAIVVVIAVLVLVCAAVVIFVVTKQLRASATTPGLSFATNVTNAGFNFPGANDGELYASNKGPSRDPSYAEIPAATGADYQAFSVPGQATNVVDDAGYQWPEQTPQVKSALPVSDRGYEMPTLPASKPEPDYDHAATTVMELTSPQVSCATCQWTW